MTGLAASMNNMPAIIPVEDLELLDALERQADLETLRQARAEDDGTRIRLDDVLAEDDH